MRRARAAYRASEAARLKEIVLTSPVWRYVDQANFQPESIDETVKFFLEGIFIATKALSFCMAALESTN